MSLTAEAIRLLAEKGLSLEDVIAVAAANEAERPGPNAAERKRIRDRERIAKRRQKERLSRDIGDTLPANVSPLRSDIGATVAPEERHPRAHVRDKPPTTEVTGISEPNGSSSLGRVDPKRATRRCPADFVPSHADLAVGDAEGFTPGQIERELAMFRDHTFGTPRSDWSATLRNWFRNSKAPRNGQPPSRTDHRQAAYRERLQDIGAAMDAAVLRPAGGG